MSFQLDPEKDVQSDRTLGNGATRPDSSYLSDTEKDESDTVQRSAIGIPDLGHDEVEQMNAGHLDDLERQHSTTSIKAAPEKGNGELDISRINTRSSAKSKLSRIATGLTSRSKKARLEPARLPLSNIDDGIVGWESQTDPEMPLNFPESQKWFLISLIASITFISPLASSMFAPAVSFMDSEFHNSSLLLSSLTVSIFVCGFVIGPLVLAPLCEIYGRRVVLSCGNVFFCIWQIGCALSPNIASLIIFRLLAGVGGSACLTVGGGVIADLFQPDRRGSATAIYTLGPLFGPVLGPICGGFIAERVGWRWVFWVLLIAASLLTIGIEICNKETNPRVLMQRKVKRLQKELNRPELRSCYDESGTKQSASQILWHGLLRPWKMLFLSPIMFLLALYMAVAYGLLYLLFTTITSVFSDTYGWQPDICGLAFIGLGIGFMIGLGVVAKISDATVVRMTKANDGVFEPEMRLPACIFFAFFIPITFFWYGWAADKAAPWIVPIIGLIPFGFGMIGIFVPIQTYVIDSFPTFAASGVAALTVARSLFGAFLPLAGPSMYAALGLGWGNSVLGFVAIALIPAPLLIYKFGGRIRRRYPVKL